MIKPKGVILINSSLISINSGRDDVVELIIPVTDIAKELGEVRAANIVALGAFVARSGIVAFDQIIDAVKEEFSKKEKFIPLNVAALQKGKQEAEK